MRVDVLVHYAGARTAGWERHTGIQEAKVAEDGGTLHLIKGGGAMIIYPALVWQKVVTHALEVRNAE